MDGLGSEVSANTIEEDATSTPQHTDRGRSDMASTSRCVATLAKSRVYFFICDDENRRRL